MHGADFLVVDYELFLRIELHQAPLGAGPAHQALQEAAFLAPRGLCEQLDHDVPAGSGWAMWIDIDKIPRLIDRLHRAARRIDAVDALAVHLTWGPAHEVDLLSVERKSAIGTAF